MVNKVDEDLCNSHPRYQGRTDGRKEQQGKKGPKLSGQVKRRGSCLKDGVVDRLMLPNGRREGLDR